MLRANGDLPAAMAAARVAKDDDLIEALLAESGDWKELAKINARANPEELAAAPDHSQRLSRLIVIRNLAGEKQACDAAAAVALRLISQGRYADGRLLDALVLSDRTEETIKTCQPLETRSAFAFELLTAQNRMSEAFRAAKLDVPLAAKIDWNAWLKNGKAEVTQEHGWLARHVVLRYTRLASRIGPGS